MNDWSTFFIPALRKLLTGKNPYSVDGFYNPPWLLFLLIPLIWLPWQAAMLLPGIALTIASWQKKKWWLIPIVGLSVPFLAQTIYANVDWIPLLGVTFGGAAGPLLITTKPQAAGLAIVTDFHRGRWINFVPLVVAVVISFIVCPTWVSSMFSGADLSGESRNLSLFPYSIPVGLVALWLAWKNEDALWGVTASLTLAPYFYIHSLIPFLFLLTDRRWWLGLIGNLLTWAVMVLNISGVIEMNF